MNDQTANGNEAPARAPATLPSGALDLSREYWQTVAPFDPRRPLEPVDARVVAGKALREATPRASHAGWQPPADRPDPVAVLEASNHDRQPELVPLRFGRMAKSPFAFLRGAAGVMAWDLARTPVSGVPVIMDGDAHVNNFGLYGTPQRDVVVDLNDFDEAVLGPWEWDLKRLVASVNVAGRENGMSRRERRAAVQQCVRGYAVNMGRLSTMGVLDVWSCFAYAELERHEKEISQIGLRVGNKARAVLRKVLDKARQSTNLAQLGKITVRQSDGGWRFRSQPPILTPLDDATRAMLDAGLVDYAASLPTEIRFMLRRYSLADVAHRVVGVGSVGLRAYVALLFGNGHEDALLLQVKEAAPAAHAPYLPAGILHTTHQGSRIITCQRAIQSLGDPLLGYTTIDGRPYFVRQLKNMKASMPLEWLTGEPFEFWVMVCGALLARAHSRTGDAAKIAGYIGKPNALAAALDEFAEDYGDQTERDHAALVEAISNRRVDAVDEDE